MFSPRKPTFPKAQSAVTAAQRKQRHLPVAVATKNPIQRKMDSPVAPPVYRPANRSITTKAQSHSKDGKTVDSMKSIQMRRQTPSPPPVYKPTVKKIVQPKLTISQTRNPKAPPVYKPEKKLVVQPKMNVAKSAVRAPQAPPVYRPQPLPKVLQTKRAQQSEAGGQLKRKPPQAPPVYQPNKSKVLQQKEQSKKSGKAANLSRAKSVIQRAVGFEFETGWLVRWEPVSWYMGPPSDPKPFLKKDVISSATFKGFRMEADEAENGESEIEFVTRPPIEETPAGYLKLKKVMDDIVDIGKKMLVYSGQKEFPLSLVTGVDLDDGTIVYPKDTTMSAGPQATTGLNLAVVRKFMLSFMAPDLQSKAKHPKFYGFLSLIQQYLSAGTQDAEGQYLAYPKMIAQPLLARTDFGKLFQLIESDVRDYYLQHKNKWVPDVLGMVGLKGAEKKDVLARGVMEKSDRYFQLMRDRKLMQYDINDEDQELSRKITALDLDISLLDKQITNYKESLFNFQPSKKSLEEKRDKLLEQKIPLGLRRAKLRGPVMEIDYEMRHLESTVRYANLTVENWLNSILDNNDLLPKVKDAESMGEFGQKVEKIGPIGNQEDAGIFEYRGDQASKIKLTEWPKFALNFFEKVMKAHGHQID